MWSVPEHFRVRLGGNVYIDTPVLVEAHGEALFTLKRHDDNGYLGIYFDVYNDSGEKLAVVKRNEIYPVKDKSDAYRIDGSADRVMFIERDTDRIVCDIKKRSESGNTELDVSVHLFTRKGVLLDFTPDGTNLPRDNQIIGTTFRNLRGGICVDPTNTASSPVKLMRHENRTFTGERIVLNNNEYIGCKFDDCDIVYTGTGRTVLRDSTFGNCRWSLEGPARETINYLSSLYAMPFSRPVVEQIFDSIRRGGN